MKTRTLLTGPLLLIALLASACGGAPAAEGMMEEKAPTEAAMMPHGTSTPQALPATDTPMMESPAWYSASLVDAGTGAAFRIEDLKGKVVLVETMAIWCSNCLRQQGQVKALHDLLGERDDFVSIGLDIDPNEDTASLKAYVEAQGFDWLYAVPPPEVTREIASLYGDQFLNPPSTPILVIDRHGAAHPLPFGMKSAEDLLGFIQPYLDEAM